MKVEKIVFKKQHWSGVSLPLRILPVNTEVLSSRIAIWTWLFQLLKALMFIFSQSVWQEETGRCWRSNLGGTVCRWAFEPWCQAGFLVMLQQCRPQPRSGGLFLNISTCWAGTHETCMLLPAPGLIWMNNYWVPLQKSLMVFIEHLLWSRSALIGVGSRQHPCPQGPPSPW